MYLALVLIQASIPYCLLGAWCAFIIYEAATFTARIYAKWRAEGPVR